MNKDNNRVYGFLSVSENVNDSENKNCYPLGWKHCSISDQDVHKECIFQSDRIFFLILL